MVRDDAGEQKEARGKECVEMKMEDRISELPDEVLLCILSFLPMYQVVRTSILSRRWRHLWTEVPVLDFGTHEPEFTQFGIESLINCCLMLYNAPKIKRFRARIDHTRILHHNLDAWLRFALQHTVEELDMDFITGNRRDNENNLILYLMPGCLFHCRALRALRLRGCMLKLPATFCLCSLRTLELYQVIFVSTLNTAGFPLLESLTLYGCNSSSLLSIYSPNQTLKKIKIYDERDVIFSSGDLIINASYPLSIEISGYMRWFYGMKNLASVTLDFTPMFKTVYRFFKGRTMLRLLESLRHAKTLKLCQWCIQDMDVEEPILENSPLSTTCLELGTSLNIWDIRGMTQLLIRSHDLETLIVDIQKVIGYVTRNMAQSEGWEMLELAMSSLLHLKTVQIYNVFCFTNIVSFSGEARILNLILMLCEKEIKLQKVVLKSCKMLNRMFISAINTQDPTKWMLISELLLILTEELQNFPRASANAEIYLC